MPVRKFDKSSKLDHVSYDVRGPALDEAMRMEEDGINILKLNIQLFAEKAKLDYVLDKGEEGNKSRRFYEQRLKGKDANHNQELVDMLKGQNETYNPIGNEALLRDANKLLRDSSLKDELTRKTLRYRTKEMLTPVEVAAVQLMINDHINNGDLSMARKLVLGGARKGTELGRAVQAFSMMARLTPEGLLRAATRATRRAADKSLFEGADGQLDIAAQKVMDALEQLQERGNVSAEDVLRLFKNLDKFGAPEQISRVIKNVIEQAEKKGAKANKSSTTDMNDPWTLADEIAESAANDGLSDVGIRDYLTNLLGLPKLTDAEAGILIDSAMRMQNADKDSPEWQQAMDEACTVLASKIPNTTWEVLTEWRKFAMLFNLKTHARNYFSNVAYRGVRSVDSFNESMLQALLIKLGKMNPEDRSAYFGWSFTEQGRNLMKDGKLQKAAEAALSERKKTALKYGPDQAALQEYRQYFKQKWLNKIKDKNYQWMEMEDAPFFKSAYVNALGQYLVSKGETEISQEADNYAYQRALEAIFSADNAISNTLSSLKQQGAFGKAVDVAVPFHRTPSNVLVQGFYHSPLGLIKGSYDLVRVLRGAKTAKTAADAINEIAKGMTGTMLFGIGILLGSLGMFNTGYGKTEKERAADELAGVQENAIVIGDFSMSLDWLQPAAAPLIMGASIAQRLNEDGQSIGAVFGAVMDGTDSLFELTMLQSLYDALGGYDAGVTSTAGSLLENVVSQSVPTVVGQAARTIDPTRRKTNGSITGLDFFDTIINQIVAKIPGLTYLLDPELDVWGNEVYRTGRSSTGSSVINAIQQFALPINIKIGTGNGDAISEEIERLYSEHGSSAIPTAVSRDEAMDGGLDYVESNRLLGAVNRQAVEDFINNKWPYTVQSTLENGKRRNVTKFYEDMTDEERVRVLKRIYKKSKEQVSEPNEADDTYFADIMRRLE